MRCDLDLDSQGYDESKEGSVNRRCKLLAEWRGWCCEYYGESAFA